MKCAALPTLFSIGHFEHSLEEFISLPGGHGVIQVSNAMTLRGWEVREILSTAPVKEQKQTPLLTVINGGILYPSSEDGA
jgi:hypothetical protein